MFHREILQFEIKQISPNKSDDVDVDVEVNQNCISHSLSC